MQQCPLQPGRRGLKWSSNEGTDAGCDFVMCSSTATWMFLNRLTRSREWWTIRVSFCPTHVAEGNIGQVFEPLPPPESDDDDDEEEEEEGAVEGAVVVVAGEDEESDDFVSDVLDSLASPAFFDSVPVFEEPDFA